MALTANGIVDEILCEETKECVSMMLVRWGGYAGEEGPIRTRLVKFGVHPSRRNLIKFFGAGDAEHLCEMGDSGYAQVLVSVMQGGWVEISVRDLFKHIILK